MIALSTSSLHLQLEPRVEAPPRQLLTPLPTPGHFLLVIDNSSLERFTTCPKSADYNLVRRREAHARNAALTFGGAIHEGLELFLTEQYWNRSASMQNEPDFSLWFDKKPCNAANQDQAIVQFFTDHPAPLDEYRTVTNALAVLAAYRERASLPDFTWEIQADEDGPLIERAFELPLGVIEVDAFINMPWLTREQGPAWTHVSQIHVAWSGRIDAIAKANGALRVVDHKTTSFYDQKFLADYEISNQILGYVWAARQLWPELDIRSFCLNAIFFRRPSISHSGSLTGRGPRGGEAPLNFHRTFHPTNAVGTWSDERIASWAENTLAIVSDFIHCLVRDYYPRHTKWCAERYGMCQYHSVCTQDEPKVRAAMLASDMFKNVTWDPVCGR